MIAWLDSVAHAPPSAALPVLLIQLLHLDISYSFLHLDIAYTTGDHIFPRPPFSSHSVILYGIYGSIEL